MLGLPLHSYKHEIDRHFLINIDNTSLGFLCIRFLPADYLKVFNHRRKGSKFTPG
jgi:hypothetical protein